MITLDEAIRIAKGVRCDLDSVTEFENGYVAFEDLPDDKKKDPDDDDFDDDDDIDIEEDDDDDETEELYGEDED